MCAAAVALMTLLCGAGALLAAVPAGNAIPVIATFPVLKDFAEQIGRSHVNVTSLITGLESEHTYSPKPSDLVAVRHARILLEVGLGLEVWVASLVKSAGNPKLLIVTTSKGIALVRDHDSPDEVGGNGHPAGNPHVWLDPENAKVMMRHIAEAFVKVDPAHAAEYRSNQADYLRRLDQLQEELGHRLKSVTDRRIIVHHPAWPYFARRFGFQIEGEIVNQPGAEPSARHVRALVDRIRSQKVRVIVSEPQLNQKIPAAIARETGATLVTLTPIPGGIEGTETYLDLLRYNVLQLAQALEHSPATR